MDEDPTIDITAELVIGLSCLTEAVCSKASFISLALAKSSWILSQSVFNKSSAIGGGKLFLTSIIN